MDRQLEINDGRGQMFFKSVQNTVSVGVPHKGKGGQFHDYLTKGPAKLLRDGLSGRQTISGTEELVEAAREVEHRAGLGAASLAREQRMPLQQKLNCLRYPSMKATSVCKAPSPPGMYLYWRRDTC